MAVFPYKAFISYNHADERWAKWLHVALETYRLPKELGASRHPLKPVFRDRDELAAARDLSSTIRDALSRSENLVVVCSRDAAKSEWVNAEVAEFIRLGRNDRIFCLFVDAAPPELCLPESLKSESGSEPLGADVRADGRVGAKLKLISGLLDLSYDTLRQRDKERRRGQLIRVSAASVAAIGLASFVTYRVAIEPPCLNSDAVISDVWNEERVDSIKLKFLSAGLPFSEHAVDVALLKLSDYAGEWVDMHRETCEATMVRGEQSPQLMDLRMACLADRRQRFDALTQQFLEGDFDTVNNAVSATNALGQLSRCADRDSLLASYPPPEPEMIDAVSRSREQLAELRALVDSAAVQPAAELARLTSESVEGLDYPPVQAEALVLMGRAQALSGEQSAAESTFLQAASKAVLANDNYLAAEAWLRIPPIVMERVRGADEARNMLALAQAYVDRLPDDHPLRASYHARLGQVLVIQGEIAEGVAELEQAIALARAGGDIELPNYLNILAKIHARHLELEPALLLVSESMELSAEYFGTEHPAYAATLQTQAGVLIDAGDAKAAIAIIEQSLAIESAVFPPVHAKIAATYQQLGTAFHLSVQPESAEEALSKALAIYAELESPSPVALGDAHNSIGNLYSYLERFDESELHLQEAARLWESVEFYQYSIVLNNLGSMVMGRDEFEAARDYCTRALAADELQFPPDSPNIAYPLSCLGEALVNLGEAEQAIVHLSRAFAIRSASHTSALPMAHTRIVLAMALWEAAGDPAEIRSHYEFALDAVIEANTGDEAAIRGWAEGKDF